MKGLWIKTDGTKIEVESKEKEFTLKELQGFVGGLIELVPTKDISKEMYINEEGKLDDLPVNPVATKLYKYGYQNDVIFGDAFVIKKGLIK